VALRLALSPVIPAKAGIQPLLVIFFDKTKSEKLDDARRSRRLPFGPFAAANVRFGIHAFAVPLSRE
jgi:hypothetical protein